MSPTTDPTPAPDTPGSKAMRDADGGAATRREPAGPGVAPDNPAGIPGWYESHRQEQEARRLHIDEQAQRDRLPPPGVYEHEIHPDSLYVKIFASLALMTLLEVAGVWFDLTGATLVIYVLGLAIGEALLIAGFFMHLRYDDRILTKIALLPLFFVIVMIVGIGMTTPGSPGDDFLAWCGL